MSCGSDTVTISLCGHFLQLLIIITFAISILLLLKRFIKHSYGSGKVTMWTKPGLYGVTSDAWTSSAEFDAATLNNDLYGAN